MTTRSYAQELISEGDEEYERQLETQARRDTELKDQALLGDDVQKFLGSSLGRALWKRAERDRVAAAMKMMELSVDAADFKEQFSALKAEGMGGTKFIEYCASIEATGDAALRVLQEGES